MNSSSNSNYPSISLDTLVAFLRDQVVTPHLFGVVQLSFQSGQLQSVRVERTLKAADFSRSDRTDVTPRLVKGTSNDRTSQQ
jgi:hypothetical protein